MRLPALLCTVLAVACCTGGSPTPQGETRQTVDDAFVPDAVDGPAFARGAGARVVVDQAHANFHTASGRYAPFARLLERDGFVIDSNVRPFDSLALQDVRVLVISNALHPSQRVVKDWRLPILPAFTPAEVNAVGRWVAQGGAILLIADHMPFAGAARELGAALGVQFLNGFALADTVLDPATGDYPLTFRRADGNLIDHPIIAGGSSEQRIDSVTSYTGSAFRLDARISAPAGILRLPANTRVRLPQRAWEFSPGTPEDSGPNLLQGAAYTVGKGRVAVFGEAAMFTAQRKGAARTPMGMNAPAARQNAQFVLNTVRWLARVRP